MSKETLSLSTRIIAQLIHAIILLLGKDLTSEAKTEINSAFYKILLDKGEE